MSDMNLPWRISCEKYQKGDYTVEDSKGRLLICDAEYYPCAPDFDTAVFLVSSVNKIESQEARIQELEGALRQSAITLSAIRGLSPKGGCDSRSVYEIAGSEIRAIDAALSSHINTNEAEK